MRGGVLKLIDDTMNVTPAESPLVRGGVLKFSIVNLLGPHKPEPPRERGSIEISLDRDHHRKFMSPLVRGGVLK